MLHCGFYNLRQKVTGIPWFRKSSTGKLLISIQKINIEISSIINKLIFLLLTYSIIHLNGYYIHLNLGQEVYRLLQWSYFFLFWNISFEILTNSCTHDSYISLISSSFFKCDTNIVTIKKCAISYKEKCTVNLINKEFNFCLCKNWQLQ